MMGITEADTCRMYVLPKLREARWTDDQIREQKYFTAGRIFVAGRKHLRRPGKKADYLLHYRADFRLAVIEAKASYKKPADGIQQGMEYAEILGLRFAYGMNGHGIAEHDDLIGKQQTLDRFPSPDGLWHQAKSDSLRQLQAETATELDSLLPSILDKAFKGEL